jgi:hypothetical protein
MQVTVDAMVEVARRARPCVRSATGRCYELAYRTLFEMPASEGWHLVHGEVDGLPDEPRIGHAWLEFGEAVYDPVTDQGSDWTTFERLFGAVAQRRYTLREAVACALSTKHYGPWPD